MKNYKQYIIKKHYHISEIIGQRQVNGNKYFTVYKAENKHDHFRYAISIGRKYGKAVERNRIKRQIHHIIYQLSSEIHLNYDIVIIVKPQAKELKTFQDIKNQLEHVLKKAKIIMREE